jgi:hypothetical protein
MDRGMRIGIALAPLGLLATVACGAGTRAAPAAETTTAPKWRAVATQMDRGRLSRWRTAWIEGLASARKGGAGPQIDAERPLFSYDQALEIPMPPAGDYRCRVFKLGARPTAPLPWVVYPWFACRVERDGLVMNLSKLNGSQRHIGRLFDDTSTRAVFLGTLALGDETSTIEYGRDNARDLAGFVERVGPKRWRVAMPYPAFESVLDVMELVPAG